jgi:hypothetical protein
MSSNPAEPAALPAGISAHAMASLFGAINGLRNRSALIAMMGCMVAGVLVALLLTQMGTLGVLLAALVWIVAAGTGINAAGVLHMDDARGISPRSMVDALVYGLMCIPKLIALGILLFLVELAVFLVIAIVLFICKIPFLGPILFAVAFPVSVVVAGITVLGLFLCLVLSLPAIWQGATIMRALAQTLAIARSRIVEAILLLAVVWLLSFVVAMIVFGVLFAGLMPTLGMSAGIVGFGGGFGPSMGGIGGMGGMSGMGGMGGGSAGHAIAGMLGGGVLWAVAATLVAQVYLLGLCIVYLRVTEGLDLSATEAALRQKLEEARSRAGDLGEKARAAVNRATAPPPPSPAAPAATQPPYPPPSMPPYPSTSPQQYTPGAMAAGGAAAAVFAPAPPPTYTPPSAYLPDAPPATSTDIDLSFDDVPPAAPTPAAAVPSATPPAYAPPAYVAPPVPPEPALPAASTCPQCLSPVTAEDVFCGVCGYRLK